MMARYLGARVVAWLTDDDVTEIYANPHDAHLRLDTRSRGKVATGQVIPRERLEMFLNAVASAQGTLLTPTAPTIQAELPERIFRGARLQGFIPPATQGPAMILRKRPASLYPLDSYVEDGIMPPAWRDVLRAAVVAHETAVVVGGTGTGKSALLGALLLEVAQHCPGERVAVLEDTVELECPVPDHLALRTTPELSLAALIKATLRTSPTRIVIGEVRDEAALDFLDAAVTGHPGSLCTVHASTAVGALRRLDRLAQRANVPPQAQLVADAIDLVVVLAGTHRTRRATSLARVSGLDSDGRYLLHHCTETGTWIAA